MTKASSALVLLTLLLCSGGAGAGDLPRAFFFSSMGGWNVATDNINSHEDKPGILALSYDTVGRVESDGQIFAIPRGHELSVNSKVTLETTIQFYNTTIAAEKSLTSDISVDVTATSGKNEFSVGASEKTKDEAIQITSHNLTLVRGVGRAKIFTVHRVDAALKPAHADMLNALPRCDKDILACQSAANMLRGTHYVSSFTCGAFVELRSVCSRDELDRHTVHEVTDAIHASLDNKYNASASSTSRDSVNSSLLVDKCQTGFRGVGSGTAVTINEALANGPKAPAVLSVVLTPIGSLMTANETAKINFNWFADRVVQTNKAETELAIAGDAYVPRCQQLLQQCTQVASQCASQPVVAAAAADLCFDPCKGDNCKLDYCLSYCVKAAAVNVSAVCANLLALCANADAFVVAARAVVAEGAVSSELVQTIRKTAVDFAVALDSPTIGIGCECAATPGANCARAVKEGRGRGKAVCPTRMYGMAFPRALTGGGGVAWPTSADLRLLVQLAPVLVLPALPPHDVDTHSDSSVSALSPSEIGLIVVGAVLVLVLLVWCVVRRLQQHASHADFVRVA